MERASRVMGKLNLPDGSVSAEQLICAAWKSAVGDRIAQHSRADRMVREKLMVGVDDAVWQRQLFAMSRMILSNLEKALGPGVVRDLEFRVAPLRRGPQRAGRVVSADDADTIADPGLRRLYITARKKELA